MTEQQILFQEHSMYVMRKDDGVDAYLYFSAQLRINKLNDDISAQEHIDVSKM